jgi:hypothetical protein
MILLSNYTASNAYRENIIENIRIVHVPKEFGLIHCYKQGARLGVVSYNYERIASQLRSSGIFEELMQNRFHPKNIPKFEEWGYEKID